ncbi:hypothetical protein K6Z85_004853 [Salmonella enterica]|nr:hypothetical protein [Salmonella enterica]
MRVWDIPDRNSNFMREYNRQRRGKKLKNPKDDGKPFDPMASIRATRNLRQGGR